MSLVRRFYCISVIFGNAFVFSTSSTFVKLLCNIKCYFCQIHEAQCFTNLILFPSLPQTARLQAELERSHAATVSKEHELARALQQVAVVTEQLESVSQEREILLRTTEMYEMEKRELQDEVMIIERAS